MALGGGHPMKPGLWGITLRIPARKILEAQMKCIKQMSLHLEACMIELVNFINS